ncbi:NAD-dependent epimerase/dehydratase family protein [Robiginitalea sp. SC105]|uniref:NAD-dependent epimerase/dehydratase family protein n=1 Tax=Robiginitalea sp. SC105 TaxID=2762332 RepID=UPI00163A6F12|nr:NAD-dependent epimerase/dehydratase family protein [Robiginitalea sp. SC105]MBC2839528.1 NAD-dependent epimerase/dehydratase family protein [Robiginitalea sp. SC105]
MQTILGSGGAIGKALANDLRAYTSDIRLVSRNPEKAGSETEIFAADLTDADQTRNAVAGSEVAYLTVGLPYSHKTWAAAWPRIMENAIEACSHHGTRLVFFDNVYMYSKARLDPMTENHPVDPPSKKGQVRARIAQMLMDATKEGRLEALIARSADFYGPAVKNVSILAETVIKPLSQGKKANWLGRADKKHSFTYVPDASRATALLGNSPGAYGEVWHLPTAPDPYTGKEWVEYIAKALGTEPAYREVGKYMLQILGLFMPVMRETVEMIYQYDRDYVFDSSKFESRFSLTPTPYAEGIRQVVASDFS